MAAWGIVAVIVVMVLAYYLITYVCNRDAVDFDPEAEQEPAAPASILEFKIECDTSAVARALLQVRVNLTNKTDWYPADTKPVRTGCYPTRPPGILSSCSYSTSWTGSEWVFENGRSCYFQNLEWMGLTAEVKP
jgi:hypothetical protein